MINHPDHLHCVHIHAWHVNRWCYRCRHHWEETCGELHCRNYEQVADMELARLICLAMEDGDIPVPAEFANLEIPETTSRVPAPSAN